jgi:hypothetical protein
MEVLEILRETDAGSELTGVETIQKRNMHLQDPNFFLNLLPFLLSFIH